MFEVSVPDPAEVRVLDDAALIDAIADCARTAAATEARKLTAIAELERRRCTQPEHPLWACDDTDTTAAEISAALTIGHGRALGLLYLATMLRDRMPKLGALFLTGALTERTVSVINNRTYLVEDPQAWAELDTVLAEHVTSWGPLSEYKLIQAIDAWVDRIDPGALRRTRANTRNRDFTVANPDEQSGTTAVYGRLLPTDAALLDQRVNTMARSVCDDDPRTLAQRRADALGALAAGSTHLTCQCGSPTCDATADDGRATSITIHVLAEETAVSPPAPDPQIHGEHTWPEPEPEPEPAPAPAPAQDRDSQPTPPPAPAPERRTAGLIIAPGAAILAPILLADLIARGATVTPLTLPSAADPRYRPGKALDTYIRMRDLTCRFPGCDRPAVLADIDHTTPYPAGPTHPGNLKCYCRKHHLVKTFWPGWTDHQLPDGTIVITTPTGHTYTTKPGSKLLFPTWNTTTPPPPPPSQSNTPETSPGRELMMPTRKTTRAKARHHRIQAERALNDAHVAERNKPPPF